jgi:lipopolysaccharide transport system permease protein
MVLFLGMLIYFAMKGSPVHLTSSVLLFPVLVLIMALLGFGLGLIITAMTTRYRDLSFLVSFGVQLLMYMTTVIYPLSSTPERYRNIIELNPMTAIIEAFRFAFLGRGEFSFWSLGYSACVTLVITFIGVMIFNKTERNFVDTV